MVVKIVWQSVYDVRSIKNLDLPKVEDFFKSVEDKASGCRTGIKGVRPGRFCPDSTSLYVWECVGYNLQPLYSDWHLMTSPSRFAFGLAADGFVFEKITGDEKAINIVLCREYKSFTPPDNSGSCLLVPFENQYTIEEYSMGTVAPVKGVTYGTNSWVIPFNKDNRGIICMYNKLWLHTFFFYNFNADDDKAGKLRKRAIFTMELLFQPVKVSRYDYWEHQLQRFKCNPSCDIKQDVYWLPCITEGCGYPPGLNEIKDDDIILDFKELEEAGRKAKGFQVTGKEYKEGKYKDSDTGNNYIEVVTVRKSDPGCDCDALEAKIKELTNSLSTCQADLAEQTELASNLKQELDSANDKLNTCTSQLKSVQNELAGCQRQIGVINKKYRDLQITYDQLLQKYKNLDTKCKVAIACCNQYSDMQIGELFINFIKYAQGFITTQLERNPDDFDRSFITILENYVGQLDYTSTTGRGKTAKIFVEWNNIPKERQGPICPLLIFLCLFELFTHTGKIAYPKTTSGSRITLFNGFNNDYLIQFTKFLYTITGITADNDYKLRYITNIPFSSQVTKSQSGSSPSPATPPPEEDVLHQVIY